MVDAEIDESGKLVADMGAKLSAGALRVSKGGLHGVTRGRILQDLPYEVNFEQGFDLKNTSTDDIAFSYPPLPWLGARMRWQVQKSGDNYLAGNTLDRVLFQRAINFVGHKDMSDYTMEAGAMTDGDRRIKSNIGLINQRCVFALIGNGQKLEVFSNYDRFRHSTPFTVKTKVWYRLKTRVDLLADGTGMIRAKAWEKDSPEPEGLDARGIPPYPTETEHRAYTPCPRKAKRRSISTTCPSSTTTKTSLHLMKITKKFIPLGLPALILFLAPNVSQAEDWPIWGRTGPATWYLPRAA